MTDDTPKSDDGFPFIDNPHAPDVFADEAIGFFALHGNVRVTFTAARVNHITSPGPVSRVVIGRLVMNEQAAEHFARGLLSFIEGRKQANEPPQNQAKPTIN